MEKKTNVKRYSQLVDLRFDSQLTILGLNDVEKRLEEVGLLGEVNESLLEAKKHLTRVANVVAETILIERAGPRQEEE